MPNWCVTNWAIRGSKEKIQKFCDIVNELPNREDVQENGFGKYWLINLAVALGLDYDTLKKEGANLRGTIEDDGEMSSSMWFPGKSPEEEHDKIENHFLPESDLYIAYFSTVSAWSIPVWLQKYFDDNGITCGFKATDEFRNFNEVHNKELFPYIYEVQGEDEWEEFQIGQEKEAAKFFNAHCSNVELNVDAINDFDTLCEECSKHETDMHDAGAWIWIYDEV